MLIDAYSKNFISKQKNYMDRELLRSIENYDHTQHSNTVIFCCTDRAFRIYFFKIVTPSKKVTRTIAIKIKNRTLAIDAAPSAIPENPKIAATIAITRKIADHLSI